MTNLYSVGDILELPTGSIYEVVEVSRRSGKYKLTGPNNFGPTLVDMQWIDWNARQVFGSANPFIPTPRALQSNQAGLAAINQLQEQLAANDRAHGEHHIQLVPPHEHSWVMRQLLTSTYEACSKCGIDRPDTVGVDSGLEV